jgi:hypothetical protein
MKIIKKEKMVYNQIMKRKVMDYDIKVNIINK